MKTATISKQANGRYLVTFSHPESDSYSISYPTLARAQFAALTKR